MQDLMCGFLIQESSCGSHSDEIWISSPDAPTRQAKVRLGEDVEGNMTEVSLGMDEPEPTGVDVTPRASSLPVRRSTGRERHSPRDGRLVR